ncbi:MAG: CBS and ACT domain-containing protein [Selenomonadaceae bacterium]|nr:CBS and ACT domain-containing protein [Selenomonadaceae bacterium]
MFVNERMTTAPITVTRDTGIDVVMNLMKRNHIRHIPVAENGHLYGFVDEGDMQKASPSTASLLSRNELITLLAKIKVREVMPRTLISINQNATIEEAALLFKQSKRSGLPVVDDAGIVVGVITETDVFESFIEIMGLEKGTTRLTAVIDNRPGTIAEICGIFAENGINIENLVTVPQPDDKLQLIIRGDFPAESINGKLAEKGIKVTHSVRIGD